MISHEILVKKVQVIGFSCNGCGACCQCTEADSGLVMVSCEEVHAIIAATNLSWDEIAMPYPDLILDGSGGGFTLGWCLRQKNGACRFLENGRCTIYQSRPWICRTYPFMLDGDELVVSDCPGLKQPVSDDEARLMAEDLLRRHSVEEREAVLVHQVLARERLPAGSFVVIDSEGMRVIDG